MEFAESYCSVLIIFPVTQTAFVCNPMDSIELDSIELFAA